MFDTTGTYFWEQERNLAEATMVEIIRFRPSRHTTSEQRCYGVVLTFWGRYNVHTTSIQCCFNVVCRLGRDQQHLRRRVETNYLALLHICCWSSWTPAKNIIWTGIPFPSRQNCRKSSEEECIFDYMALYIECRFNKISLLQCYFLAILLAGLFTFTNKSRKSGNLTASVIICTAAAWMFLDFRLIQLIK